MPHPAPPRTTRPATAGDIPAMRAILRAHGDDAPSVPGGAEVTLVDPARLLPNPGMLWQVRVNPDDPA